MAQFKIAWVSLICLALVASLGKSYETSLRGIDSNIHAKASLDVTSNGFTPKLPIPNVKVNGVEAHFNDHPFFYFWVNGWIMRTLGPSAWSARVLTGVFSVGCVLLTFALGKLWYSPLFGFLSALFFLFCRDMILTGATVSLDPPMLFFILLSFFLWQKNHWYWVGLCTGIGLWIKTPVVLLVFPTAFLVSMARGTLKKELPILIRSLALACGVGSLIWILTGFLGGWTLVTDYWMRQVWGTAINGRHKGYPTDWFMFFKMVRSGFLPGLPFLLLGILRIFKKRLWHESGVLIPLTAITVLVVAITPIQFKLEYYFNPAFPFLAILSSYSIIKIIKPIENRFYTSVGILFPLVMAFLLCTPTSLGPEGFVALKRFMPFIQTQGNCKDRILLIPGGEPIGSAHDYSLVLNFYTKRNVFIEGCGAAEAMIRSTVPEWIILSRDNLERCLTPEDTFRYRTRYEVGKQILLSRYATPQNKIDLTPLDLELKPILDCDSEPQQPSKPLK